MDGAIQLANVSYRSALRLIVRNSCSSSSEKTALPLAVWSTSLWIPTALKYGVLIATAEVEFDAFDCLFWYIENIPVTMHREPGTTRLVRYLSVDMSTCRGNSPTGTWSGASCNLMICWSTNCELSCTTTYGSMGHCGSPGIFCLSHILGNDTPANPPCTGRTFVWWQLRHWICKAVAFDDRTDAPITMPGTLTSLEIVRASKLRMDMSTESECRRSWCCGRTISLTEG